MVLLVSALLYFGYPVAVPAAEAGQPAAGSPQMRSPVDSLSSSYDDSVPETGTPGLFGPKKSFNGTFDPDEAFLTANELYIEGKYEEAIGLYGDIAASGYQSPALFYNLGNAYYRSNKIPQAILNYERAALLSPGDEDISFNLELSRTFVRDRIEELPDFFLSRLWNGVRDKISAGAWAGISVILFISSLVFMAVFLISPTAGMKKAFFWLAIIFFLSFVMSYAFGLDQRNHLRDHSTAIVFSPVVSVKSSPDMGSADLFVIHEGTKVWVEDSIGDWRAVRLADGNKGWLLRNVIEMI